MLGGGGGLCQKPKKGSGIRSRLSGQKKPGIYSCGTRIPLHKLSPVISGGPIIPITASGEADELLGQPYFGGSRSSEPKAHPSHITDEELWLQKDETHQPTGTWRLSLLELRITVGCQRYHMQRTSRSPSQAS